MKKIYDLYSKEKKKCKKLLLKLLPYFVALITGIFLYDLANILNSNYHDLIINISATFFSIPLLYFIYETAESFSHKRLNREVFDYAKMQIDRELLSILNQLQKIVYPLEEKNFSFKAINIFLSLERNEIKDKIKQNKYLGFQIFKEWEGSESQLHEILKNPFILEKLKDEQIISIIEIISSLRQIEFMKNINDLYIDTNQQAHDYTVKIGTEINSQNIKFPDRCLLLKHLHEDKFIVSDFGDIPKYSLEKCLNYYEINLRHLDAYSLSIFELLTNINNWLDLTGKEMIIDPKMFKIRSRKPDLKTI